MLIITMGSPQKDVSINSYDHQFQYDSIFYGIIFTSWKNSRGHIFCMQCHPLLFVIFKVNNYQLIKSPLIFRFIFYCDMVILEHRLRQIHSLYHIFSTTGWRPPWKYLPTHLEDRFYHISVNSFLLWRYGNTGSLSLAWKITNPSKASYFN